MVLKFKAYAEDGSRTPGWMVAIHSINALCDAYGKEILFGEPQHIHNDNEKRQAREDYEFARIYIDNAQDKVEFHTKGGHSKMIFEQFAKTLEGVALR